MPTATVTLPPRAAYTSEPIYRFTVAQWRELIDRGTLTADDPVELIEGVPVFKMPKNEPHVAAGRRLRRAIERVLPEGYFYDSEQPVVLADSTLDTDRGSKRRSYARAAVGCYWIVNLIGRRIERYTDPDPTAVIPGYRTVDVFGAGDAVPLTLGGRVVGPVPMADVSPPT